MRNGWHWLSAKGHVLCPSAKIGLPIDTLTLPYAYPIRLLLVLCKVLKTQPQGKLWAHGHFHLAFTILHSRLSLTIFHY
jgi:hypothetical protein